MPYDTRSYEPFYDKPVPGFGFDSPVHWNTGRTLAMHDCWSFYSYDADVLDKKSKKFKPRTVTDKNVLVLANTNGLVRIRFVPSTKTYAWSTARRTKDGVVDGAHGVAATQSAAEIAALRAIGRPWLYAPAGALVKRTFAAQSFADIIGR